MSPVTHYLLSWIVANSAGLERKERAMVTLAGVAPEIQNGPHLVSIMTDDATAAGAELGFAEVATLTPGESWTVLNVESDGAPKEIIKTQCEWHERLARQFPDAVSTVRLSIDPRA